ncbi:MAG: hypothetical protein ABJI41_00395 [Erythrobacter sp.]
MGESRNDGDTPATTATAATWGVPNWGSVEGYGKTEEWSTDRWRWEFVRRRDDVRKAFDETAVSTYRSQVTFFQDAPEMVRGKEPNKPDEPGFVARHPLAKTIGLTNLPNPRIGNQPFHAIAFNDWPDQVCQFHMEMPPEGFERVDFDLNKPLEPQLKFAKQFLRKAQIELHGKPLQSRRHSTKWLGYLRTLDAREAGASWSEIAKLHPHKAETEQAGRDACNAANALRFNF